jgi:hypothetical protein
MMAKSAEYIYALKTPKAMLEKRLERWPNSDRAHIQLFTMLCCVTYVCSVAKAYGVEGYAR